MTFDLGKDPIILISLSFLEILLILIPALIASRVEKKPFLEELKEMGFQKKPTTLLVGFLVTFSLMKRLFKYMNLTLPEITVVWEAHL